MHPEPEGHCKDLHFPSSTVLTWLCSAHDILISLITIWACWTKWLTCTLVDLPVFICLPCAGTPHCIKLFSFVGFFVVLSVSDTPLSGVNNTTRHFILLLEGTKRQDGDGGTCNAYAFPRKTMVLWSIALWLVAGVCLWLWRDKTLLLDQWQHM